MDQRKEVSNYSSTRYHVAVKVSQDQPRTCLIEAMCSDDGTAPPPPRCSFCTCSFATSSWALASGSAVPPRAVLILSFVRSTFTSFRIADTVYSFPGPPLADGRAIHGSPFAPPSGEDPLRSPALFAYFKAWVGVGRQYRRGRHSHPCRGQTCGGLGNAKCRPSPHRVPLLTIHDQPETLPSPQVEIKSAGGP